MASIVTGDQLGTAILKALGIEPKNVMSVVLHCEPNQLAMVSIVRSLDQVEGDRLLAVLEGYCIEPRPQDPAAAAMETVARNLTRA